MIDDGTSFAIVRVCSRILFPYHWFGALLSWCMTVMTAMIMMIICLLGSEMTSDHCRVIRSPRSYRWNREFN